MIHYLKHKEIDKRLWDACVAGSVNRRVYAFSWYLDIVCPGWDALVTSNYSAVFPVTHYRKYGVRYLAQPYFTQQLGLFSSDPSLVKDTAAFIAAIPARFKLVEINLNSANETAGKTGTWQSRRNHEMSLAGDYQLIASLYSKNTDRNIRKSRESGVLSSLSVGVDELISLFASNYGKAEGKLQENHYDQLRNLLNRAIESNTGSIRGVTARDGALSSAAFFLFDGDRVYFLFAASAPEARTNGSMFHLIDGFIESHAGSGLVLDFEGGNDPDLGRFYKGFGAKEVYYPSLRIDRLPGVTSIGRNFLKRLTR